MGSGDLIMKHTVLNVLQHSYTVPVPTAIYAVELKKIKEDKAYVRKSPAAFTQVVLHPGVNRIDEELFLRLNESRIFKGLLELGSIKCNDSDAEHAYHTKLNPRYESSKEYAEAKAKMDLELKNKALEGTIADLKANQVLLQEQIEELRKLIA